MSNTSEMLVALALAVGVACVPGACRCDKGPDPVVPEPDPGPIVDAAPEASVTPEKPWDPVVSLSSVEGLWGSKDAEEGWAELSSKATAAEKGDKWRYPYPWHLLLHVPGTEGTYDCGVHDQLEDPGDAGVHAWRVAWCEGADLEEGRRHAKRLVLHTQERAVEFILISLEGAQTVELDRN